MSQKNIIVYTSTDQASRVLKSPVQVLFTLTTEDASFSPNSYPAVAWKILTFQPKCTSKEILTWGEDIGFSIVKPNEDGTLAPGDLCAIVDPKYMVMLQAIDGLPDASEQRKMFSSPIVAAFNKTGVPHHLALCTVENTDSDNPKFSPVIDLGDIKHSQRLECGRPVMLQAYAVSKYKEGQVLKAGDLSRALFVDPAGDPEPIDIREIKSGQAFRLYSHFSGKVLLQKVE